MRPTPYIIFLVFNFGALALGGWMMGGGPSAEWYQSLNKAPWTPPGWVFGAAWTTIMICYTFYMGAAWNRINKSKIAAVFGIQWILNVSWNPVFFYFHETEVGLVLIGLLTILLWGKIFAFRKSMKAWGILLLPYSVWLSIATSLNLYIVLYN